MCPVALLLSAANKSWIKAGFLKRAGRGDTLGKYLQLLTTCEEAISPYALRIGGRTWYVSHGLDRQFCDYLGTWKSPEASARYYRASPATVLYKLQAYFYAMTTIDDAKGNFK